MSKIITSFDIGIKNLAYCRLRYYPDRLPGNQFEILDWDNLNLLDDSSDLDKNCQMVCKSGIKLGKTCPNKAHYRVTKDNLSLCRNHSKSYAKSDLTRLYTCANITTFELARLAIRKLDQIDFSQCHEVIFESQPPKATKMKNFSMMLMNYFVIRYVAEKEESEQVIEDIKFISAKNKLTIYDGPYVECKLKNQYGRNKFYGKIYCQYLIRHNQTRLAQFLASKKKDDLADCALQGMYYLMSTHSGIKNKSFSASSLPTTSKPKLDMILKLKKNYLADPEDDETEAIQEYVSSDTIQSRDSPIHHPEQPPVILKLKPKLSLRPQLAGRDKLMEIRHSQTTRQFQQDYQITKYRNLKKGYKPAPGTQKYTLSNLKYIIEHQKFTTRDEIKTWSLANPSIQRSIEYYFGTLDKLIPIIIK